MKTTYQRNLRLWGLGVLTFLSVFLWGGTDRLWAAHYDQHRHYRYNSYHHHGEVYYRPRYHRYYYDDYYPRRYVYYRGHRGYWRERDGGFRVFIRLP